MAKRKPIKQFDPDVPTPDWPGKMVDVINRAINPPAGDASALQLPQTPKSMGPVLQSKFVGNMPGRSVRPISNKGQGQGFHAYKDFK